jgi:hypothetical protein
MACRERLVMTDFLVGALLMRLEHADLGVVEGLLALERGEPALAERRLREAVGLARDLETEVGLATQGRPVALAYLRRIEAARAANRQGEDHGP